MQYLINADKKRLESKYFNLINPLYFSDMPSHVVYSYFKVLAIYKSKKNRWISLRLQEKSYLEIQENMMTKMISLYYSLVSLPAR